jgi:hypothetical protein
MLAAGTVLAGRYLIEEELGRGGAAIVYAGRDRQVGTPVALKVLVPAPAVAHIVRERTRREIKAVRALAHPNVVPIFDLIEEGPWTILVMERVRGADLQAVIAARGPLPPEQVAAIGQGVAEALAVAHRRGIVHRDVKPRNILLDVDGRPRLTDFGSARVDGQETLTETGGVIGTLDYAAPEVVAGGRGDARADLHALGLTLYLALVGSLPARSSPHLPPRPAADGHHPRAACPSTPPWLDAVVARATAAEPRRRFPTAAAMAEALASHELSPLPEAAVAGTLDFCLACGAPEPFGRTLCPRCAPPSLRADSWLVAQAPPLEQPAVAARIAALLRLPASDESAVEAASGRRVLARVPRSVAERAARQLQSRGIPTRVVSSAGDWRLVPSPLVLLTAAIAAVGTVAGATVHPPLLLTTPAIAGLLLALGHRAVARPLLVASERRETLPPALAAEVSATLSHLPDGDGRLLLADLVRLGRGLFAARSPSAVPARELLAGACRVARELGQIEGALSRLAEQRPALARVPESWVANVSRLEAMRDALLQHMLDAVSALGSAITEAVRPDADVAEALSVTSREIEDELALQAQARKEVEELLR